MRRVGFALLALLAATPLFAWGEKGHYMSNEAAAIALPTDMPQFFYKAIPDLVWLGFDPDRWKGSGPSIDANNPQDHFLDFEYVSALNLPPDRFAFISLLMRSGTTRRYGIGITTAGFLPWRIAELEETLTGEFRLWRASVPGSIERQILERDIIHNAGVLGHFVADSANPQHTTINFNGWVLPNPNHYAIDCDAHARFENDYVSSFIETRDVVPYVAVKPQLRTDYFNTAVDFIKQSNGEVETLYRIDREGGFDIFRPVKPEAKAFAAQRIAAGATLLRDLWWSAWMNSAAPRPRRGAPPPAPVTDSSK